MKNLLTYITLAGVVIAGGAVAEEVNGKWGSKSFYMGALLGQSSINTGVNTLVGATLKEEDTASIFFIGSEINKNISVEGFYGDFGEASLTGSINDTFDVDGDTYTFNKNGTIKVTAKSVGIAAKLRFDISDKFKGFAKGGWHWWDSETTLATGTSEASEKEDGSDLLIGLGLEYDISEKVAFTVGYDRYKFDQSSVAFLNGGIRVQF